MLVRPGRLEGRELTVEQARGHKMTLPRGETLGDQLPRPLQVSEPNIAAIIDDYATIAALQRRAGDQSALPATTPAVDNLGDCGKPRRSIPSVNGCRLFILATFAGGCSLSPSSNLQQSRFAKCCPIVVLPAPDTPMMTTIAGPSTDYCAVPRHRHRRLHRAPCPQSEVSPTLTCDATARGEVTHGILQKFTR